MGRSTIMIGIVTPLKVNNYGTKLQAYAVQKKLQKFGYDNEIILYDQSKDFRFSVVLGKIFIPKKNVQRIKSIFSNRKLKKQGIELKIKTRNRAIASLDDVCYKCTPVIRGYKNLILEGKKYDAIVCGSDQVWNPEAIGPGYSSVEFISNTIKIAFSPSFGVSEIPDKMLPRYRSFLNDFLFLSSREDSGVKLIKKITGKTALVTADPTLTLEKTDWEDYYQYSKIKIPTEPYIFCYFLGNIAEQRQIVKKLKEMTGYQIVAMPHFKCYVPADENYADLNLFEVSPADFIKLIANAEYICTDSFHGMVFSNIFERNYFVFERYQQNDNKSTNSRIYSLLKMLGTTNRLIRTEQEMIEIYKKPIEYSEVNKKLAVLRKETDCYLQKALSTVKRKEIEYV